MLPPSFPSYFASSSPSFPPPMRGAIPRARIDPIRSPFEALRLVLTMMSSDGSAETLVVALDDRRCGIGVVSVVGTDDPDAVLAVIDTCAEAVRASPDVAAFIVASVRPDGECGAGDLARWREADESCRESDIELVEWFIVGTSVSCPRALCGVPSRWTL